MLNVTKELTVLARKLGYEGKAPDTVAKAINAITSVAGEGGGSNDGCDCEPGYQVVETELFSETVTTTVQDPEYPENGARGTLAYSELITADALTVTFDGTDYTCPRISSGPGFAYGGYSNGGLGEPDFTDFPFVILSSEFMGSINNIVFTAQGGTHTISVASKNIETSEQFRAAVDSVVDTSTMPMACVSGVTTYADMLSAYANGRIMFFRASDASLTMYYITNIKNGISFIPEDPNVIANIDENNMFIVTTNLI